MDSVDRQHETADETWTTCFIYPAHPVLPLSSALCPQTVISTVSPCHLPPFRLLHCGLRFLEPDNSLSLDRRVSALSIHPRMAINPPTYTCKCLNVRIYSHQNPKDASPSQDDGYIPTSVDDDGIVIVGPRCTVVVASLWLNSYDCRNTVN